VCLWKMRLTHTTVLHTLCLALGLGVLAKGTPRLNNNDYFDPNDWILVPTDNNLSISSLSDLKTGVYSIELSGERSGCGSDSKGPGMMMVVVWSRETKYRLLL
jgi:hypothetical protein